MGGGRSAELLGMRRRLAFPVVLGGGTRGPDRRRRLERQQRRPMTPDHLDRDHGGRLRHLAKRFVESLGFIRPESRRVDHGRDIL